MHRFYIPPEAWIPEDMALPEAESHHCLNVLRLGQGDRVTAFNGRGYEITTTIAEAQKGAVKLASCPPQKTPELQTRITLCQAVPKGKNMDLIIEKATELGVADIHPLLSERTIIRLDAEERERKREKWQRVAIEACKQSGQNWLPTIHTPQTPESFFTSGFPDCHLPLVASLQPGSRRLKDILSGYRADNEGSTPDSALILIGPEGDYTPAEINMAQNAGCLPMTLGPIVLRTETAAIYSLSILAHELL
ncbi:MAG: 16S rRNA (uracil(1498)-N(3))-methyltransferase [Verrucomicrobiaceae bacterium]|nr:16S rRNA (uracil(1498)-N(3))-methyltransferase [Verrucomicrobiaceae bacterium]